MKTVNVSIQIIPGVSKDKVYPVVDKVIALIAASGYKYLVGPMETTIEGDLEGILSLIPQIHQLCESQGADRSLSIIKIDYKKDGVTMDEKIHQYR
jgi:uncharacterized protein YqgV (UPF0045/DUF77 family)